MFLFFDYDYKYIRKVDFHFDHVVLNKLYAPLLSSEAFKLYSYMCSEINIYDSIKSYRNKIGEFCLMSNIDKEKFEDAKNNLEALGLLKTFVSKDKIIYFDVIEPLKFDAFIENIKLKDLFIKAVGENAFHKIMGQFSKQIIGDEFEDITINGDKYFEEKQIEVSKSFNFQRLYENLSKATSIHVTINDQAKESIEYNFLKEKLSFAEIEKVVFDSIIKEKNDFIVSNNLLDSEFKKLCGKRDVNDLLEIIPINRNKNMFIEKSSISSLQQVFHDYRNLSSERFLSCLFGVEISDQEKQIISEIRTKYSFPDSIINIMIDYSIPKTHSVLNAKYLNKMARSFKAANIIDLNEAYEFLFNWTDKKNSKTIELKAKRSELKKENNQRTIFEIENNIENKIETTHIINNIDDEQEGVEEDLIDLDW